MNDVKEFCDRHGACPEGRAWAITKASMAEVFDTCQRGDWLMWALIQKGALDKPTSVRLACAFASQVFPEYEKQYNRTKTRLAIEAALRWADEPTKENSSAALAAGCAALAAGCAALAADCAVEQKTQCEIIRAMVKNPWRTE